MTIYCESKKICSQYFFCEGNVQLASIDEPVKISYKRGSQLIEETKPKYAWVSTHTARRSFCTNEYLACTPSDLAKKVIEKEGGMKIIFERDNSWIVDEFKSS